MSNQPIKCRAAVLYKEGEPHVIEEIVIPAPSSDQIRIKMVSAGICASDAHMVWGEQAVSSKPGHSTPTVMGHEGAGVVESIGPQVQGICVGDHVLTSFLAQCGQCASCVNPHVNQCQRDDYFAMGQACTKSLASTGQKLCSFLGVGAYSEYVLVRESQVTKVPFEANLEHSCVISCAVATGFYSATNMAKVSQGSTCAIWGIGAIGLNAIQGAKFNGAKHILAIDLNPDKRATALHFGATEFINPRDLTQPIEQYLREKYSPGVDFAFDCFGSSVVLEQAWKSLSTWGTLAMVGIPKPGTEIRFVSQDMLIGRKIVGGLMGQKKPKEALAELTRLYVEGKYDIDSLVTNKFRLEQVDEAFATLRDGKCIRSLIVF